MTAATGWQRRRASILLFVLLAFYGLAASDGLTRLPIAHGDEMWNAAPAYMLATTGVYGSDLFRGFAGAERRTYQFMPMLQLLLAGVFRVAGVGLLQMRLLSVAVGAVVLTLTYFVGRQAGGSRVGLLAVLMLTAFCLAPLRLPNTGIVLVDLVRTMRYHILVPAFGLGALLSFNRGEAEGARRLWMYALAGALAALAYLSHMYGAFWLPALVLVMVARRGVGALVSRQAIVLAGSFALTCVPWAIYVVTDLDEYVGQMQMYSDRFDLWHAAFYWTNITREIRRYAPFLGGFTRWHPGGWIAVVTFPLSVIVAVRTSVRDRSTPLFAVVVVLFVLVTLDALLLRWKTFTYLLTPLPLAVVIVASGWTWIWDRTRHAALRVVLVCALVAAMTDAGWRLVLRHRQALVTTPYEQIEQAIARQVPADARVLMALRFWLGLRNQPVRTWVLPLMLAECDACDRPRALAGALRQVAPEIVVIDDFEFGPYLDQIHDPADPGHWQDAVLRDYFLESGLQLIGEVRDPDYKTIRIYRVERP